MRSFPRPAEEAAEPLLLALLPWLPWLPTLSLASVFSVTGSVAGCNVNFERQFGASSIKLDGEMDPRVRWSTFTKQIVLV